MDEKKKLFRIRKNQPMWNTNAENEKIYGRKITNFISVSGRIGGKTFNMRDLVGLTALNNPTLDIVILRANSSQLKQSVFLELKKFFWELLPMDKFMQIEFRQSPPLTITMPAGNQILFGGVGLGSKSSSNQSRGKTAERKLALIVVEETQEIFSGSADGNELINQAIATYIRYLDTENGKIIYLGNRERNINAKFNVWVREKEKDSTYLVIETNWHDIEPLLTRPTITMILQERELNPNNYKYMYLGIPVGGADLVYGAFTESTHVLTEKQRNEAFAPQNHKKIWQLYIGVDGSTTHDKTVFMPIFHFSNAKLVLRMKNILYHDPLKNGVVRNSELCKRYVKEWLVKLIDEYELHRTHITFVVDGHNSDLIDNLRFELAPFSNVKIEKFTRKDLIETSEKVNNAFVEQMLYLSGENWFEMITGDEIHESVLYNELQTVCWREDDDTKFNDAIPNDLTDGIRYPIAYHAANPYQIRDLSKRGE